MAPALPPPAWRDLGASAARLRLAPTLLSGMSFRWKQRVDGIFEGVLGTDAYELKEIADAVHFRVLSKRPSPDAEARLRAHLSLGRGVDVCSWLDQQLLSDPPACFAKAAAALGGVRVLNVEKLESVVAFIGSANNNIKRNMQMVESLCAHFPESRIETEDSHCSKTALHFRFPTVEQLASLSEKTLWELGWGYRAPRLHRLARELSERGGSHLQSGPGSGTIRKGALPGGVVQKAPCKIIHKYYHYPESAPSRIGLLPEVEARAKLCELSGIGRKVADCILLFSYGRDSVVPVDTHCLQIAQKRLLPSIRGLSLSAGVYQKIVDRFHEIFGKEFAGWAFMVMLVGELSDLQNISPANP
ncbi:DNA glycosylase [Pavlovales sp. CCMP2436]|nr:DNA glycosylase [Pavlovales sp. CCMP2436]